MRRKDREIADIGEIADVLSRCKTIRLGLSGEAPYVVPVSFGMSTEGGVITVYFHGARSGRKAELLGKDPRVCVEADIFHEAVQRKSGVTALYESVIGFGTAELLCGEEKLAALSAISAHYGFAEYPVESCGGLEAAAVYKVVLTEVTGKRNL